MVARPHDESSERVRQEAAAWFGKLGRPGAEAAVPAFEEWYAADPAHADAYDRLLNTWERPPYGNTEAPQARPRRSGTRFAPSLGYALAAMLIGAIMVSVLLFGRGGGGPPSPGQLQTTQFATGQAETRLVRLADGSVLTLRPDSAAYVKIDAQQRTLRLLKGGARFKVAHEPRPFVVWAGGTQVTAHGTVFDVALLPGRTRVRLLEGAVDVAFPNDGPGPAGRRVTPLHPGQSLDVEDRPERAKEVRPPAVAEPRAMLEFDAAPLAEAVARANKEGSPKIRIDDAAVARLRVSGAFRRGDTEGLARSLEAAFQLRLERLADGTLLLLPGGAPSAP
jgi:transmembrane sensor